MLRLLTFFCGFLLLVVGCMNRPADVCVFQIDVAEAAKPWEKTAARELGEYLHRAVPNGNISIDGLYGVVFHVGDTPFAVSNRLGSAGFADEEWTIRSFGRDVVLNGGGTRGALYAVYRFLEDNCGVRWWMDGDEDVPTRAALALPALAERGRPHFSYRNIYRGKTEDPRTAIRNRLNVNGDSLIPPEFGGGKVFGPPYHCHTWRFHVPWEKLGQDHPEYFSLIDGKRLGGKRSQLCLSNPDLPAVMAASVEKYIAQGEAEARANGIEPPVFYDMSQNDVKSKTCQCDACRELQGKYGVSGYQLIFENKVADLLGKRHPDLLLSVFAYYESEAVPEGGVRAADNLIVKLCNTTQNMAAGIEEPCNRFMYDQVRKWKDVAKNLFVWEYTITFDKQTMGLPFANELHFANKLRHYADNGVMGLLIEHEHMEQGGLYDVKYHLLAKLLENPYLDGEKLIVDTFRRYFGPVAGEKVLDLRRYFDRIRRERDGVVTWVLLASEYAYVDLKDIAYMARRWEEAEQAVRDDPKLLQRVRRGRIGFDRLMKIRQAYLACRKPAEKGVSERPFVSCAASDVTYRLAGEATAVVDDPEASTGRAIRIPFQPGMVEPPFPIGVYCHADRLKVDAKTWERPLGSGYQWYELGVVELPKRPSYVWMTRSWYIQLGLALPELCGTKVTVKARVKFTDDALYLDRTVFVPDVKK